MVFDWKVYILLEMLWILPLRRGTDISIYIIEIRILHQVIHSLNSILWVIVVIDPLAFVFVTFTNICMCIHTYVPMHACIYVYMYLGSWSIFFGSSYMDFASLLIGTAIYWVADFKKCNCFVHFTLLNFPFLLSGSGETISVCCRVKTHDCL